MGQTASQARGDHNNTWLRIDRPASVGSRGSVVTHHPVKGVVAIAGIGPHVRWPAALIDRLRERGAGQYVRALQLVDGGIAGSALRIDGPRFASHRDAQR